MTPVQKLLGELIELLSKLEIPYALMAVGRCVPMVCRGRRTGCFFMQGPLDEEYLRKWARKLGIKSELEKAIREQQS